MIESRDFEDRCAIPFASKSGRARSLAIGVVCAALAASACSSSGDSSSPNEPGNGGGNQVFSGGSSGTGSSGLASGGLANGTGGIVNNAGGTSPGGGGTNASGGQSGGGGASAGGTNGGGGSASGGTSGAGGGTSDKFVGNITTSGAVRTGFATYWNQITPENEGKWGSVQPTQGSFNWSALDNISNYAKSNNVIFKQHNFVWGNQQPGWVNSGNAQAAVQAWMKAFCDRYPDAKLIDVVNEPPPHTRPSYADGLGGDGATGYDWIVNAFKWARAACPNAILILNDYNNIEYGNDNAHFIDIVNKTRAAGAPIDAIGAQAHDAYNIPTNTVKGFIDQLAATGLPVYITEYDIPIADDNQQKTIMQDQMTMFWNHPNVKGITLWGYIVGATWKANTGLQQTDGTMRPAMQWLMDFLGRH